MSSVDPDRTSDGADRLASRMRLLGVEAARQILADTPMLLAELLDIAGEVEFEHPALAASLRETVVTTARNLDGIEAAMDDVLAARSSSRR